MSSDRNIEWSFADGTFQRSREVPIADGVKARKIMTGEGNGVVTKVRVHWHVDGLPHFEMHETEKVDSAVFGEAYKDEHEMLFRFNSKVNVEGFEAVTDHDLELAIAALCAVDGRVLDEEANHLYGVCTALVFWYCIKFPYFVEELVKYRDRGFRWAKSITDGLETAIDV